MTNLAQTIDRLKEEGVWVAGTDVSAPQDVYKTKFDLPLAIVIGNEGKGMGRLIKEKCDFLCEVADARPAQFLERLCSKEVF